MPIVVVDIALVVGENASFVELQSHGASWESPVRAKLVFVLVQDHVGHRLRITQRIEERIFVVENQGEILLGFLKRFLCLLELCINRRISEVFDVSVA